MKDLTKIDVINFQKEEKLHINMSVNDFDITVNNISTKDDITAKVIAYIEREIRNSYEYKNYIQYLKEELDLTKCSLLPNIDIKTTPVSLEFHHFPFCLYDIIDIVTRSLLKEGETVSCFDIAEKVVLEHFKGNIGLVPVTETIHEMAHSGAILIPFDKINGNYNNFIKEYSSYIDPLQLEKISGMKAFSKTDEAKDYNENKLSKKIINYNITYIKEEEDNV